MQLNGGNSPAPRQSRYGHGTLPVYPNSELWGSITHTALDDLESFLWLLIVHASKDIEGARANNPGIQLTLDAWQGDGDVNYSNRSQTRPS